jgi:hypothetical protein
MAPRQPQLDQTTIDIIKATVREAVREANTEHKCIVGLSPDDRKVFDQLRVMLVEHNPTELRENHEFIKWVRSVRNKVGNVFIGVVVVALTTWAGIKLFPSIFHK